LWPHRDRDRAFLARALVGDQLTTKTDEAGDIGIVDAIGEDVAVVASLTRQFGRFRHLTQYEVSRFLWRAPDLHRNPQRNTIWPGPQGARPRKMRSKELAERIGITEQNVSLLKSGKVQGVRFDTLALICVALDCQPGDILEYRDDAAGIEPARRARG
jgi:putative transcriptional regulator